MNTIMYIISKFNEYRNIYKYLDMYLHMFTHFNLYLEYAWQMSQCPCMVADRKINGFDSRICFPNIEGDDRKVLLFRGFQN